MGQSFPLEISHVGPAKKGFPCSLIINPILTKFVRSRWFDIGLVLCLFFIALDFVSVHKTAKTNYAKVTMALIDTSNEQSSWHKNVAQTEEGKQIILSQQILCTYFLSLTVFLFI